MDNIDKLFEDTHMSEPEEEQYFGTVDQIMKLSDFLSEEIVLENIVEQINGKLDTTSSRLNYITLFREKYESVDVNSPEYNLEYMQEVLGRICEIVMSTLYDRYSVSLGEDLDFRTPTEYLADVETMYEFLFIRHFENIVSYFISKLYSMKDDLGARYLKIMNEEPYNKDLFVVQAKRRFKNDTDVAIIQFMDEIIMDILSITESGFDLFSSIINTDLFEEYNSRMKELMVCYGNKFVVDDDTLCAKRYLSVLDDELVRTELRNKMRLKFLEDCEIYDEVQ